ncbi:hypothetical protein [Micromonospora sp. NBC_01796]|uniref:hypothetical protein n=1 Tax=Micromonospora sp. NBC_01796 TaxID=2975987 RepID=UPI002DDC8449|nr:hypothetical protein [Micromonospora sp. NBC_01796]WSA86487.1 hypothetical protein OIE47_02355 [Micromonospora sp. NBC_01796]
MKMSRFRASALALVAIAVGGVIAFALPAGAAVSVQSESPSVAAVTLGGKARLDANGAVVFAPVKVACTPGSYAALTVEVTQAVGNNIAKGDKTVTIQECTGDQQKLNVAVTPDLKPYRKGVAFGSARLEVCDHVGCKTVYDERKIDIIK